LLNFILARFTERARLGAGMWSGKATLLPELVTELDHLAEAVKIQQWRRARPKVGSWCSRIVGGAGGDGGMQAVGKADDEVRIRTPTNTEDLHLLAV
jgi:hypothetical protein